MKFFLNELTLSKFVLILAATVLATFTALSTARLEPLNTNRIFVWIPDRYCVYAPARYAKARDLGKCGIVKDGNHANELGDTVFVPISSFVAWTPGNYTVHLDLDSKATAYISGTFVPAATFFFAILLNGILICAIAFLFKHRISKEHV
ncbi:hypothetical protein [Leptospira ryugenii]|uniref:hypothetical protein n=1 Tax=Leptospira ryugenii TaxID=1917863 RepID=UPI000D58FCED|nr:hypothetical protein [Leptospira ryugenii]